MNPVILVAGLFLLVQFSEAKLKKGDCEVCLKFLGKVESKLTDEQRKAAKKLKEILKKACEKAKGKEERFCYYVGGTKDSTSHVLDEITKSLSYFKSVENICESLKKKDRQICDLKYEKKIDWSKINLKKMSLRQLKKLLKDMGGKCDGCQTKSDYIKRIKELKKKL